MSEAPEERPRPPDLRERGSSSGSPPGERTAAPETSDGVSRRRFGGLFIGGLVALSLALAGTLAAWTRFLFHNTPADEGAAVDIGPPAAYPPGGVSGRFKEQGFWVVHEGGIIYALSTTCTHLACQVFWLEGQGKFKCPCHGSGYYVSGVNFEGPAPRPLERYGISLASQEHLVVDKGLVFRYERGEWQDPRAAHRTG